MEVCNNLIKYLNNNYNVVGTFKLLLRGLKNERY